MANGDQPENDVAPTAAEADTLRWSTLGFPIHAVAGFLIGAGGLTTLRLLAYAAIWAFLWSVLRVLEQSPSKDGSTHQPPANYPLGFMIGFGVAFAIALIARWLTRAVI